ncbi:hypothetical protein F5148DRAFT_1337168 [Russula earlei]|uniref:Uncharacterized protein n=1 Tax=Russula earlei TaxID=71964 RepID=A0ACC0TWW9_9AGAM|nr:hypothetical protein F5148DRAFT_1337168 [Russula earlei]
MYCMKHRQWLLLLIAIGFSLSLQAQNIPGPVKGVTYYPSVRFMVNAPTLLPKLYKEGNFTAIKNFVDNWNLSPAPGYEFIFVINSLYSIENNTFSVHELPANFLNLLDNYVKETGKAANGHSDFKYYIYLPDGHYNYDATNSAKKLLQFTQAWAKHLVATRKLNSTASLVCRSIAGDIQKPGAYYRENKAGYADIRQFMDTIDAFREHCFAARRDKPAMVANFLTGIWIPTRHLAILDAHPSIGMELGWRNAKNEVDLNWSFRFNQPIHNAYNVLRSGYVYSSTWYDGGYIGLDYTHYTMHHKHFDMGYTAAVAYDYFDAFDGITNNQDLTGLMPINIGCFDLNGGIQCKYFIGRGPCIGIQAKYHLLNYCNKGGTDLAGHAFTIDLFIGSR